jgi:HD domain
MTAMTMTQTSPDETTDAPEVQQASGRWRRWPVVSALLRFAIVLTPFALACVLGLMTGYAIGGNGIGATALRVIVAGVVSIGTFAVVERLARRFLPLATLLKLSLVFPDHAPSRFSVALRSTSVRKLQQWARAARDDDGPAALAEKVVTLAAALNTHDRRTRGHSERSRAMAELIAVEMGLSDAEVNEVRWGAFLHDIGKILVPASLLNKPGAPTASEWKTLRRHPADGGHLVEPLRGFLGSGVEGVSGHHENFDGSGYPQGLAGEDIALTARIVHVADSFEVMTAVRSYKRPMKATEARQELARHSGSQFDPTVVRALLNVSLGRLHWAVGAAAWMAEVPFLTVIPRAAAQVGAIAAAPTVSMTTLSGVAAISLGSIVAPASPIPATAAAASSTEAVAPATHTGGDSVGGTHARQMPPSTPTTVPPTSPAAGSASSSLSPASASTPAGNSSSAGGDATAAPAASSTDDAATSTISATSAASTTTLKATKGDTSDLSIGAVTSTGPVLSTGSVTLTDPVVSGEPVTDATTTTTTTTTTPLATTVIKVVKTITP